MLLLLCANVSAFACPLCNKQIKDAIYNSQFYPNLLVMLSAFMVLAVLVIIITVITNKRHKAWVAANPNAQVLSPVPLTTASTILGIGGFVDGIVLHQLLQVHEMLSNKIPATNYIGKSVNVFWDGIFHLFCLTVVVVGVTLIWKLMLRKDVDCSGKLLLAGLLFGWGIFNLVEGIIDQHILELHNVIEYADSHAPGNYTFLGMSIILIVVGGILFRNENKRRHAV